MSKYTLTIEGDFQRGECEKCPLSNYGEFFEIHDKPCILLETPETCPLEEVKQGDALDILDKWQFLPKL